MNRNTILVAALSALAIPSAWAAADNPKPADIAGTWAVTSLDPQGTETRIMTIREEDGKITGTLKQQAIVSPVQGTVDGNKVTFSAKLRTNKGEMEIDFTGTVAGDSMMGDSKQGGTATVSWTAAKLPDEPAHAHK